MGRDNNSLESLMIPDSTQSRTGIISIITQDSSIIEPGIQNILETGIQNIFLENMLTQPERRIQMQMQMQLATTLNSSLAMSDI